MSASRPQPLAARGIVITRPTEQAGALAEAVADRGGRAIVFPALEILKPDDPQALNALIDRLDAFDLAIFVSPIAAERAMKAISARRALPATLQLACVGAAGARALGRYGAHAVITPRERFDSEALLSRPELQEMKGKRVVIFRGQAGRELLGDTLAARGATVEYAQCYRRARPQGAVAPLVEAWTRGEVDALVVTSSEALRNLHDMLGAAHRRLLTDTPLFVPHHRIGAAASELGVRQVVETAAGDEGLLAGLVRYFAAST